MPRKLVLAVLAMVATIPLIHATEAIFSNPDFQESDGLNDGGGWEKFEKPIEKCNYGPDVCKTDDVVSEISLRNGYARVYSGSTGYCGEAGLKQTVSLPANATYLRFDASAFKYWWGGDSGIKINGDWMLRFWGPGPQEKTWDWQAYRLNISKYAGQTVDLKIVIEDLSPDWCNMVDHRLYVQVDNFVVETLNAGAMPTPTPALTINVTATPASDTEAPSITIQYPANNSRVNTSIAINAQAVDNVGIATMYWSVNDVVMAFLYPGGQKEETLLSSMSSGQGYSYYFVLPDGTITTGPNKTVVLENGREYYLRIFAKDASGNMGSSYVVVMVNQSQQFVPTPYPTPTPNATATQTPSSTLTPDATFITPSPTPTQTANPTASPIQTPPPTPMATSTPIRTAGVACDGCLYADSSCIPFGTRLGPQYSVVPFNNGSASYCDVAKNAIELQKNDTAACQNNYECISNYCSNGVCGNLQKELAGTRGLLEQILGFLRAIFGKFFLAK